MLDSSTPSPSIPSRSLYLKQKDVLPGNWHYPTTLYISLFQFTFILFGAIHANIFRTNQRMCAVFIYGIAHSGLHTGSAAPANSMYSGGTKQIANVFIVYHQKQVCPMLQPLWTNIPAQQSAKTESP